MICVFGVLWKQESVQNNEPIHTTVQIGCGFALWLSVKNIQLFASWLDRTQCESDTVDVFALTLKALHYGSHPSKRRSILALCVCQS